MPWEGYMVLVSTISIQSSGVLELFMCLEWKCKQNLKTKFNQNFYRLRKIVYILKWSVQNSAQKNNDLFLLQQYDTKNKTLKGYIISQQDI